MNIRVQGARGREHKKGEQNAAHHREQADQTVQEHLEAEGVGKDLGKEEVKEQGKGKKQRETRRKAMHSPHKPRWKKDRRLRLRSEDSKARQRGYYPPPRSGGCSKGGRAYI